MIWSRDFISQGGRLTRARLDSLGQTTSPRQIDDSPSRSEESRKSLGAAIHADTGCKLRSWSNDRRPEMLMGHDASLNQRASMAT